MKALNSDRLTLSLMTTSDIPGLMGMFHEPGAFEYIKPLKNQTDEEYLAFLNLKLEQIASKMGYYWVIRNSDKDLVGAINLTPIPATGEMQIGWMIRTKFRGQGYASEAAQMAMNYCMEQTNINPVYGVFEEANIASQKILVKLNFKPFSQRTEDHKIVFKYRYDR